MRHWRDVTKRVSQVILDTVRTNLLAETHPLVGTASAGNYDNEYAELYTSQIVSDFYDLTPDMK